MKIEIVRDDNPEILKNQIFLKCKQIYTENPDKGDAQQVNPVNLKLKKIKFLLDIVSKVLKDILGRNILYLHNLSPNFQLALFPSLSFN